MTERGISTVELAPHINALSMLLDPEIEMGTIVEGVKNSDDLNRIESGIVNYFLDLFGDEGRELHIGRTLQTSLYDTVRKYPEKFIEDSKDCELKKTPAALKDRKNEDKIDLENAVAFMVTRKMKGNGSNKISPETLCVYYIRHQRTGARQEEAPFLYRYVALNPSDKSAANKINSNSESRTFSTRVVLRDFKTDRNYS